MASSAAAAQWTASLTRALLPSFVAQKLDPEYQPVARRMYPTSYLDGLRGIASVLVFFCHYTEENHRYMLPTYGADAYEVASSPLQLPYLRLLFSGRPMVHIFFVISGFALSCKPLKEMRARNFASFHAALASSAFRRPIRLYGPPLASTVIIFFLVCFGWLHKPLPTFTEQLSDWASSIFYQVLWPWSWDTELRPKYDLHLWTIPIEMCHSVLLFAVLFALSRVRSGVRLFVVIFLMNYFMTCGRWAAFEFIGGMFLAELHLKTMEHRHSLLKLYEREEPAGGDKTTVLETSLHIAMLLIAGYVAGWPNAHAESTWGIRVLNEWTPHAFPRTDPTTPQKFWFALCAIGVVWSCGRLRLVRRVLEGGFAQYCGRISFALYIVHGPVLEMLQGHIVGKAATAAEGKKGAKNYKAAVAGWGLKGLLGVTTTGERTLCWVLGLVFFVPLVFAAADVFCRLVDEPVVDLAKRIEQRCLVEEPERAPAPVHGPEGRREHST